MKNNNSNSFKSKPKSYFLIFSKANYFGILIVIAFFVSTIPIIFYFFSNNSNTAIINSNSLRTSAFDHLVTHNNNNNNNNNAIPDNIHIHHNAVVKIYATNKPDDTFYSLPYIIEHWLPSFLQPKFIKDRIKSNINCLNNQKDAILVPNIKFLFYVIYHNKNSQKLAQKWCQCRPWCQPIEIPTTMFFESIFYRDFLSFLIEEWEDKDFIGVGSYRSVVSYIMGDIPILRDKLQLMVNSSDNNGSNGIYNNAYHNSTQFDFNRHSRGHSNNNSKLENHHDHDDDDAIHMNQENSHTNILHSKQQQQQQQSQPSQSCDVAPLVYNNRMLLPQAIEGHTKDFIPAWETILIALGYSLSYIHSFDEVPTFYRNSFLIRPHQMKKLIYFMNRAMEISLLNSTVRSIMQKNASYQVGSDKVAERAFHTSYYQWHPFVFERLPVFYLNHIGLNICIPPASH